MSTSQFNKDIEFIKDTASDVLYKSHLKLVFDTYYTLFKEVCTGCPGNIAGYVKRIKNHKISNIMSEEKKSNFVLKNGRMIVFKGSNEAFSNANLTDEVALKFLKGHENRRSLFAKLPDDLDELLEGDGVGETKEETMTLPQLKKMKRGELNEMADDLGLVAEDYGNIPEIADAVFDRLQELGNDDQTAGSGEEE